MRPTVEVLQVMVTLLASTAAQLSGYDVMSKTKLKGGTCYNILHRLSDEGWIASKREVGNPRHGFLRRTLYYPTPDGQQKTRAVLDLLKVST